jgi:hypothetical protein
MPSPDYGDLSWLALEAELDVGELRARLARMTDRQLLEFGHAASYMCTPYANLVGSLRESRSSCSLRRLGPSGAAGTGPNRLPLRSGSVALDFSGLFRASRTGA